MSNRMKTLFQLLSGLNGSSLVRGLRFGPHEFVSACQASHAAAHPFESPESLNQKRINDALNLIPNVALRDLLDTTLGDKRAGMTVELSRYEDGLMPVNDALALLALLVAENPNEVLEIGTYVGYTTKAMAQNLPSATIHTVDLPPDFASTNNSDPDMPKDDFHLIGRRVVGREFKGQTVENRIRQHFGDTAKINFQEFGKPTFFFIDGSHTYEYCKQDSEKCFALSGGSGVFLWHDCDGGHPGVIKFLLEWRAAGKNVRRITGTSLAYWKA
jgi:hypothetical protein